MIDMWPIVSISYLFFFFSLFPPLSLSHSFSQNLNLPITSLFSLSLYSLSTSSLSSLLPLRLPPMLPNGSYSLYFFLLSFYFSLSLSSISSSRPSSKLPSPTILKKHALTRPPHLTIEVTHLQAQSSTDCQLTGKELCVAIFKQPKLCHLATILGILGMKIFNSSRGIKWYQVFLVKLIDFLARLLVHCNFLTKW